jgi:hypothetical protein
MVVPRPTQRCTRSIAEIRISTSKLNFSAVTASELGYPAHICIMVSEDGSQVAIQASEQNEYSLPFCRFDENGKPIREVISICNKEFIRLIRKQMGWKDTGVYVTPAVKYIDGDMLLFDLKTAFVRTKNMKNSYAVKEQGIEAYPPMSEVLMKYRSVRTLPSMACAAKGDDGNIVYGEVVSASA